MGGSLLKYFCARHVSDRVGGDRVGGELVCMINYWTRCRSVNHIA